MAIKTGIVGAAGFAGIELVRLVLRHPDLELVVATSNELAGTRVTDEYPGFAGATDLAFATHDDPALDSCELVFLAVPHTAALAMAPRLVAGGATVVDLSADFRLKDPAVYEQWYNTPHTATELLARAAFGLPELFPDDLARAARANGEPAFVACAGCYPHGNLAIAAIRARRPRGSRRHHRRRCHLGRHGRGQEGHGAHALLLRRREPGGLRRGHAPPHARDRRSSASQGRRDRTTATPHLAPQNRGLLVNIARRASPR